MQTPVEITWHNTDPMRRVEARINQRMARLEKLFDRIIRCHVVVEAPHHHQRQGNLYEVRLDLGLPGADLSVNRKPGDDNAHVDVMVAVRDAFDAMERQLKRWKDRRSGRPEVQAEPLQGRVVEIDRTAGSGQIVAADGRMVYFHRNAIVSGDFTALEEGDMVELVVDRGDDAVGAHASTVRVISEAAFAVRRG
jgi:ribosomal subunit interface protein